MVEQRQYYDAMRGTVPDFVLDERRKVGFNALLWFAWFMDPNIRDYLLDDSEVFN